MDEDAGKLKEHEIEMKAVNGNTRLKKEVRKKHSWLLVAPCM
jgi:hypothetical protein